MNSETIQNPATVPFRAPDASAATPRARAGAVVWGGRVLSALPFLALVPAGAMKVAHVPQVEHDWVHRCNFPLATLTPLGLLEIACAVLFVIPRTSWLNDPASGLLSIMMTQTSIFPQSSPVYRDFWKATYEAA